MKSLYRTAILLASMAALIVAKTPEQLKADLLAILPTGMKARMAWSEYNPNQKIYVVDSDTGVVRELTPASGFPEASWQCMNAHISRDGSRVMFANDNDKQSYMVNWDGTNRKELGSGVVDDYYYDETAQKDNALMVDGDANLVDLDNPFVNRKKVGSDMDFDDGVSISKDGTHIAAFTLSSSKAILWKTPSGPSIDLDPSVRGCVISIAPDNTYESMHQLAPHELIRYFNANGSIKQDLNITKPLYDSLKSHNQLASWAAGETMEHDRTQWSNVREYLTTTYRFTTGNPCIVRTSTTPPQIVSIHDYSAAGVWPNKMDLRIFPRTSVAVADANRRGAMRSRTLVGSETMETYSIDGKRIDLGNSTVKAGVIARGVVIRRSQGEAELKRTTNLH